MTQVYAPGSMVRARGRDWVVLPGTTARVVRVRPADGRPEEATGILAEIEPVLPASFGLPDISNPGDHHSTALLRDALLSAQSTSAGPLRCFARLGFNPRAYQLVPLLVALRMDPVRLLLADDVGLGKTAEAALIARELLDRGEIDRVAVLCPPVVAGQWRQELKDKVGIDAAVVLPHTARRLERECPPHVPLFQHHRFTVVSTEFIKSPDRIRQFVEQAPPFIIVDEAHGFALPSGARQAAAHRRHELLATLAHDPARHLVLVTATPHSGDTGAFRSLAGLLNPALGDLPDSLAGEENEASRLLLARHMVQRRRADISRHFTALDGDPPFPRREETVLAYKLGRAGHQFLRDLQAFLRDAAGVEGWSYYRALSLLRAAASSPHAAAESLRFQAGGAPDAPPEADPAAEERDILDEIFDRSENPADSPAVPAAPAPPGLAARLFELANKALALAQGDHDAKFTALARALRGLLAEGFHPIVFCRFLKTASYLEERLRAAFPGAQVAAVTGAEPPETRVRDAEALGRHSQRILVATPCLAEGVNLQHHFSAVVIYDMAWNPNSHEQAFGRVDRFGQPARVVRVAVVAGEGHPVDEHVARVLYDKDATLQGNLGVSHFLPDMSDIVPGFLARELDYADSQGDFATEEDVARTWRDARERESRVRTLFSQVSRESMRNLEAFTAEVAQARAALGGSDLVPRLFKAACLSVGAQVTAPGTGAWTVRPLGMPLPERDDLGMLGPRGEVVDSFTVAFSEGVPADFRLHRSHDIIQRLASRLVERALASPPSGPARRCGAIATRAVATLTAITQWRLRFELDSGSGDPLLAEEIATLAWRGLADKPDWLSDSETADLLAAEPAGNLNPDLVRKYLARQLESAGALAPRAALLARQRAQSLQAAHLRVRQAAPRPGARRAAAPRAQVRGEPELLAITLFFPAD